MIAKLGEQSWEMVSAVPGGGRTIAITYVFKRPVSVSIGSAPVSTSQAPSQPAASPQPAPQVDYSPLYEEEEEEDDGDFEPLRGM